VSDALRLCWLPASVCAEVSAALQDTLAHWTSTWGLPSAGPVHARLLEPGEAPPSDGTNLHGPASTGWRDAIARALFPGAGGESAIVDGVVHRAADHLDQTLCGRFPRDSSKPRGGLPGHRGLRASVDCIGQSCWLELGCAELRAAGWLKPSPLTPLPPVDLERAASGLPVALVAELGRVSVAVSDLVQLAPGDVLLLEETLDEPLRVVSAGSAFALSAQLGAITNPPRRAARWLAS